MSSDTSRRVPPEADEQPRSGPEVSWMQRARFLRQGGLAVVIVVMAVIFGVIQPSYFGIHNLLTILEQSSISGILAIGVTFVIITAGIDLSFGSALGLTGVVFGLLVVHGAPFLIGVLAAVIVGIAAGVLNGIVTTALKINPLIVTLGTMSIFSGIALLLTGGNTLFTLPPEVGTVVNSSIVGIPTIVLVFAVVTAVCTLVLSRTKFGEYCIATGGNAEVARLAGIRVGFYVGSAYALLGFLAGLAGVMTVGRLGAANPTSGADLLLPVIAASVIGGASLAGGEGSIIGAALGAIFLAALQAGLTILVISAFYQQIVIGAVIVLAVAFDQIQKGRLNLNVVHRRRKTPLRSNA